MNFHPTKLHGVWLIEIQPVGDDRGFFASTFSRDAFVARGLDVDISQSAFSFNRHRGTLRGMHFQAEPHSQAKVVRCTRGAVYDVVVDLRPQSPSFQRWVGLTLSAERFEMVYVPRGCAHGFETLEGDSELDYLLMGAYHPDSERGFRWDEARFKIEWPFSPLHMSQRDATYPSFSL